MKAYFDGKMPSLDPEIRRMPPIEFFDEIAIEITSSWGTKERLEQYLANTDYCKEGSKKLVLALGTKDARLIDSFTAIEKHK